MEAEEKTSRLETVVAVLIALTTVIGAVIAWRASLSGDASGDADFAGLKASLYSVETRAVSYVNGYEHYGAYLGFARNTRLGDELAKELQQKGDTASEAELLLLERQQAEAYDLAKASQRSFPARFLSRDGSYNLPRELSEMWADAAREKDLKPDPQYADADRLRTKTNQLLATLTLLGLALVSFSLVESVGGWGRPVLTVLGVLLTLAGTGLAVYIDVMIK